MFVLMACNEAECPLAVLVGEGSSAWLDFGKALRHRFRLCAVMRVR